MGRMHSGDRTGHDLITCGGMCVSVFVLWKAVVRRGGRFVGCAAVFVNF